MTPDRNYALTTLRRGLFMTWIVAAIVVAALAMLAGPVASRDGVDGTSAVALLSPLAMLVFVVTGLAWLAILVLSRGTKPD